MRPAPALPSPPAPRARNRPPMPPAAAPARRTPPSAICATQPASSHETPSASEGSAGGRRIGIGSQPFLHQERILGGPHQMQPAVPAAHADIVAVAGDQDIRLRHRQRPDHRRARARPRRTSAAACAAGPSRMIRRSPRSAARSRTPPCGRWRPGSAATHCVTAIIQSMPMPIIHQNTPSKPNGIASRPSMPAGITTADTTGIAARLASTP